MKNKLIELGLSEEKACEFIDKFCSGEIKRYGIKVYYTTGDSFGSQSREEILDYTWLTKETALKNCSAIEKHSEFVKYINSYRSPLKLFKDLDKKYEQTIETLERLKNEGNLWWLVIPDLTENDKKHWLIDIWQFSVNLWKEGEKDLFQLSTSAWIGYFESLDCAEVIEL